MDDGSLVLCRCEEVRVREIDDAVGAGARTVDEVKHLTRAGMGICQGRTCLHLVSALVAERTGEPDTARHLPARRVPLRPVRMAVLRRPLPEPPAVQLGLLDLDPDTVPDR